MNMKAIKFGLRTEVQRANNCTVTKRLATRNYKVSLPLNELFKTNNEIDVTCLKTVKR